MYFILGGRAIKTSKDNFRIVRIPAMLTFDLFLGHPVC